MAISQNIKKKIAKEIIYFFSAVVLLLLIWVVIGIRKNSLQENIISLNRKYVLLEHEIDSIENTYPKKAKSFNELMQIKDNGGWVEVPVDDWDEKVTDAKVNTFSLYNYLVKNNFDFTIEKMPNPPTGYIKHDYAYFRMGVSDESFNKQYMIKVYSFLKSSNQLFSVDTNSFFAFLQGLPEPPSNDVLLKVTDLKREKDETYAEYKETSDKKYVTDDLMQAISGLFFILLYPVRVIFLLLLWAVRTVKQKEN